MPFINWSAEIEMYMGKYLPHWHQAGAIQFITFRLKDSLPQTVLSQLQQFKITFNLTHPKPWDKETTNTYHDTIGPYQERMLTAGYGSYILRKPEVRRILSDSLLHEDGKKYVIHAFVIMPNHVHLLMSDLTGEDVNHILSSIQRFSATQINRLVGRKGRLWMDDDFDRLVRSQLHFKHCLAYIISNPRYLPPTDYTLYLKSDLWEIATLCSQP